MPYRELTMIDVKEVLRRWSAAQGDRQIARECGADRKTIARYTKAALKLGLARGCELTDDVVHEVAQCVQARPLVAPSDEWNQVTQHRPLIERWLAGYGDTRPLKLTKIHTLLVRDHGLTASYDTLWRFAHQELAWREKPSTVRIDDPPPGQEAQIDFGKMGFMIDPDSGRKRRLWALIVTLVFSRYQFVWPTFLQTTAAVCEGLDRAWMFFRGIVATLIPDNTKAMVNDPDALDPTLVAAFLDYVQARAVFGRSGARPVRRKTSRASRTKFHSFARAGSMERRSRVSCTHARALSTGVERSPVPACMGRRERFHERSSSRSRGRRCDRLPTASMTFRSSSIGPKSTPTITSRSRVHSIQFRIPISESTFACALIASS
jgi:hypothetical protein